MLDIVAGGGGVDQILASDQADMEFHLRLMGGGSQDDPHALLNQPFEQRPNAGKGRRAGQIVALEQVGAPRLDVLASGLVQLRKQRRQQIVATLADLRPDPLRRDVMAELEKRLAPGFYVEVVVIDEGSVDVEKRGARNGAHAGAAIVCHPRP